MTRTGDRLGDFLRDYELYLDGKLPYEDLQPHLVRVSAQISHDRRPHTTSAAEHADAALAELTHRALRRHDLWSMFLFGCAVGAVAVLLAGGLRTFA